MASRFTTATIPLILLAVTASPAIAQDAAQFNLPSQDLAESLKVLGVQTKLNVLVNPQLVDGLNAPAVKAHLTTQEALSKLLSGTGLEYRFVDEGTVVIQEKKVAVAPSTSSISNVEFGALRLAQASQAEDDASRASSSSEISEEVSESTGEKRIGLEEIIVTATKRAENIQDVPISIAVVSADEIDRRGLASAEDYLRGLPGVNQTESSVGTSVVIRGLETTTTFQNFGQGTSVASYFGETPTTNSAGIVGGASVDAKLVDIERVEVLRGPQGTAFGNSSLGGAVRTIPVVPKLDRFEGKVGASYSVTSRAGDDNNMIQAVGNVPVIEGKLAIRASAYRFKDSGFYRNVAGSDPVIQATAATYGAQAFATNEDDVGASSFTGGRIAALFQPSEDLKFTLTYLTQKTEVDGWTGANRGGYNQAILRVGPEEFVLRQARGGNDTSIDLANAVMEYDLGWGSLLATYSHIKSGSEFTFPWTIFSSLPVVTPEVGDHREHNGEIRLATRLDGAWDFLAGLYAEKLEDAAHTPIYWYGDPATSTFPSQTQLVQDISELRELTQQAAFGEVSWSFLPRLTLTGGARLYDYDRARRYDGSGDLRNVSEVNSAKSSGTNFRGNLSYKPNDDTLVYAGWSQGFRLGTATGGLSPGLCDVNGDGFVDGTNISIASTKEVRSDSVDSYEIGSKFALFNRRLTISADIFRANWSDMPAQRQQRCGEVVTGYTTNLGRATSEGIEVQASSHVTESLRIDASASWIHARLTTDVPAQGLFAGDELPSPKVNASLGLQYALEIGGHTTSLRAESIYVGPFYSQLPGTVGNKVGDYVKLDASARVVVRDLNIDLFVRNLTNADDATFFSFTSLRMRPRTIGIQLSYDF